MQASHFLFEQINIYARIKPIWLMLERLLLLL